MVVSISKVEEEVADVEAGAVEGLPTRQLQLRFLPSQTPQL